MYSPCLLRSLKKISIALLTMKSKIDQSYSNKASNEEEIEKNLHSSLNKYVKKEFETELYAIHSMRQQKTSKTN